MRLHLLNFVGVALYYFGETFWEGWKREKLILFVDFSFPLGKKHDLEIVPVRLLYHRQLYKLKIGLALDLDKLPTLLHIWVAFQPSENQMLWSCYQPWQQLTPRPCKGHPGLDLGGQTRRWAMSYFVSNLMWIIWEEDRSTSKAPVMLICIAALLWVIKIDLVN